MNLKHRYHMTEEQVDEMLEGQGATCAICLAVLVGNKFRIDHDHLTGKVRGILCHRCNIFCAAFDDKDFLMRALVYLG